MVDKQVSRAAREELPEVEGGGDEFHHGLLFEAEGGGAGGVFGVEGAVVLAGPAETPAVARLVDVGGFCVGKFHLEGWG